MNQMERRQRDQGVAKAAQPVDENALYGRRFIPRTLPYRYTHLHCMLHNGSSTTEVTGALDAIHEALRFERLVALWHMAGEHNIASDDTAMLLHRANFDLWHLEDAARDPHANDSMIAKRKRQIDAVNQLRNNLAERVDEELLSLLASSALPNPEAPQHSETPGMILDRLSILSLKIFHTAEEVKRKDATPAHIDRNRQRLSILRRQSIDLAACLAALWAEVCSGTRRFALYKQMKMYNDPELNPVLYSTAPGGTRQDA